VSKVFDFYLKFAQDIINIYQNRKGDYLPLAAFLKEHFKKFPKAGSRDRKTISRLIFNYYRTGKLFANLPLNKQLYLADFLCETNPNPLSNYCHSFIHPELSNLQTKTILEKITLLKSIGIEADINHLFPLAKNLSELKKRELFLLSFIQQPKTFIRIRKGKEEEVKNELAALKITHTQEPDLPQCLRFDANISLTELQTFLKGFFEIQDRSSQQVLNNIQVTDHSFWWDACCASGGKSLMLIEKNKTVRLFATDVRQNILDNYRKRISKVGFGNHETQVANLTQPLSTHYSFDGIICDVPCSGSGTWARTPEQLQLFKEEQLIEYTQKQKQIIKHTTNKLRKGGQFIYITCSVFKQENEDQVHYIQTEIGLKLISQQLIEGAEHSSDTMFVACFTSFNI